MSWQASGVLRLFIAAGALVLTTIVPIGAQVSNTAEATTQKNQNQRTPNPQPEVPSKLSAAASRESNLSAKVSPTPAEYRNPKALNPQPEVPSKVKRPLPKKKPGTPATPKPAP